MSTETPNREAMPLRRRITTQKVRIAGNSVFFSWSCYPDGRLGSLFIDVAKAGASLRFWATGFARLFTVSLQHGTPLKSLVGMFAGSKAEPWGVVEKHPRITQCSSILDLVVRSLAIDFLGRDDLADVPAVNDATETGTGNGYDEDEESRGGCDAG